MKHILIRSAQVSDAEAILQIHYEAVHQIAKNDYGADILDQWSTPINEKRIDDFVNQIRTNPDNELMFVAIVVEKVVGFGAIVPDNNELRAVYVSPEHAKKGVGRTILKHLENEAIMQNVDQLNLDSSLTAEKFYLANSYLVKGRGVHKLKNGAEMKCVYMYKKLTQ